MFHTALTLLAFGTGTRGPIAQTQQGAVRGFVHHETGCSAFLGVPYAAPPTGARRFMLPQPAVPWGRRVRDATQWGAACLQPADQTSLSKQSENCLSVNIFVPNATVSATGISESKSSNGNGNGNGNGPPKANFPVMVFFHGGGFQDGDAQLYPGYALAAASGTVVVTVQYRVNIFGFLYLGSDASDSAKSDSNTSIGEDNSNAGLEDQREALRWVQRNIGAFGGDRGRVQIFGQSAGGASVVSHLVAPGEVSGTERLYRTAVVQSPGGRNPFNGQSQDCLLRAEAAQNGVRYAAAMGCNSATATPQSRLTCMQRVDAAKLLGNLSEDTAGFGHFAPHVDGGRLLLGCPLDEIRHGRFRKDVPVIIGNTAHESGHDAWAKLGPPQSKSNSTPPVSAAAYRQALHDEFEAGAAAHTGVLAAEVAARPAYAMVAASPALGGRWAAFAEISGDAGHTCLAELFATALTDWSTPSAPIYRYLFNHTTANWTHAFMGPTHAAEMPYLFCNASHVMPNYIGYRAFSKPEQRLARTMARLWGDFARGASATNLRIDDNGTMWPTFGSLRQELVLDVENSVISAPKALVQRCADWLPYLT